MKCLYVNFDGSVRNAYTINKIKFNGYQVVYQPSGSLWRIMEMKDSCPDGLEIKFWPSSRSNVINYISLNGMFKWFNNSGELCKIYNIVNASKYGECFEYGNRCWFYKDDCITNEVLSIIDSRTVLTSEDKFNLYIKYGSEFKLYEDYNCNIDYNKIIELCFK